MKDLRWFAAADAQTGAWTYIRKSGVIRFDNTGTLRAGVHVVKLYHEAGGYTLVMWEGGAEALMKEVFADSLMDGDEGAAEALLTEGED